MGAPGESGSSHVHVHCRNCGAPGVKDFCPACGQEIADRIPTLREWLKEVREEYWVLDGKVVRSLVHLIARPGLLTFEWIDGRRQLYIRPFRLFFIALPAMLIGSGFAPAAQWILVPASVIVLTGTSFLAGVRNGRRASMVPHLVLSLHSHALLLLLVPVVSALLDLGERLAPAAGAAVLSLFPVALLTYLAGTYRRWLDNDWIRALLRAALVLLLYALTFAALFLAVLAVGAFEWYG